MLPDTAASKVTAAHLSRTLLYVRQSSLKQVIRNTESAIRQYDLRGKAVALGWDASQVTVIDIDQGQSGSSAADREGFQQLVAEVSLGRAGIVLGLECSRLARNNADWHQLLEICAMTGTLICDEDGLYDPRNFNDRLLLGMKGQMSEMLCRYRHNISSGSPSKRSYAWEEADIIAGHGSRVPVHPVSPGAALTCATPVRWRPHTFLCQPRRYADLDEGIAGLNGET